MSLITLKKLHEINFCRPKTCFRNNFWLKYNSWKIGYDDFWGCCGVFLLFFSKPRCICIKRQYNFLGYKVLWDWFTQNEGAVEAGRDHWRSSSPTKIQPWSEFWELAAEDLFLGFFGAGNTTSGVGCQCENHSTHETFLKIEVSAFKYSIYHKHLEMSVTTTYLSSLQIDSFRSR